MLSILLLFVFVCFSFAQNVPPERVHHLPHFDARDGPLPSISTGYINVNQTFGRHIFYWLIEATDVDPKTAPLVVWFQGGPGGSGEFGLFYEQGPLALSGTNAHPIVTLRKTGAWTKWTNMIFIDQPAGVSFSYSTNKNDYALNSDTRSARDNFIFIKEVERLLPHLFTNGWWIAGESYGGVYCPMLAYDVARSSLTNHFKGVMIGNPVFRCDRDEIGSTFQIVNLLFWHGMVSFEDMTDFWDNDCTNAQARAGVETPQCKAIMNRINTRNYLGHDFDGDDLYMDSCIGNATLSFAASEDNSNCIPYEGLISAYLKRTDVQKALHARAPDARPNWAYDQNIQSMNPFYEPLIAQKKSILIYSGDVDIQTVPFAYTMPCLHQLKNRGNLKTPWQPWYLNGHTAGRFEQFDAYTYATVRGGGHETPAFTPLQTDAMFYRFLTKGTLHA